MASSQELLESLVEILSQTKLEPRDLTSDPDYEEEYDQFTSKVS